MRWRNRYLILSLITLSGCGTQALDVLETLIVAPIAIPVALVYGTKVAIEEALPYKDVSQDARFANLINKSYVIQQDLFLCRHYFSGIYCLERPGYYSDVPKTIEQYLLNPEKWNKQSVALSSKSPRVYVLGIAKKGTHLSILEVKEKKEHLKISASIKTSELENKLIELNSIAYFDSNSNLVSTDCLQEIEPHAINNEKI